uniref:Uncharacterized protein n=1 Tax=viral metagenome TaxID=1070528 RepID=A0A6C0LC56_9ZZZZ
MDDFLSEQEMQQFQVGGFKPVSSLNQVRNARQMYNQSTQLQGQLQGQASQYANDLLKSAPSLQGQASQYANDLLKSAPSLQGQASQYANDLLKSAPSLQGQASQYANDLLKSAPLMQGQASQLKGQASQYANNLLKSMPSLKEKVSQLTGPGLENHNKFLTLVENLAKKGAGGAIRLLGSMLGVSVTNIDPNKLVDALNEAAENPETQQKLLELTDNLIKITKKPLEDATTAAASLIGNTLDKEGKQGIKLGWDLLGDIPVAGEFVELVKTGLDAVRAGEVGVDAAEKLVTVVSTPVSEIAKNVLNKNLQAAAAATAAVTTAVTNAATSVSNQLTNLPGAAGVAANAAANVSNQLTNLPGAVTAAANSSRGGGAATEKQYNQYKKLQLNAANRLSQSFQGFYGTRKQRKGSRKRGPKIHMKTRTRRTKRAKY